MKQLVRLSLCFLLLAGCVGQGGSPDLSASSSRGSRDDDGGSQRAPRQMCENTSIAGEPKSFCY